ncbi:MAG: tetratricopeptide repeat protein, partial [Candidatus Latescibacteria bacterium]|nr:tetratricopeptide repeat protein [Candidatus Latescibacterota bacterium]
MSRHARAHGFETLGAYYRETGQREQALASFARAVEVDPHNRRYGLLAAREALALQRPETAVRILTAAVAVAEEDPPLWDLLGTAYAAAGRYGDSVAAHRRAVARQGRDAVQWYNLGNALLLAGEPIEALAAYA